MQAIAHVCHQVSFITEFTVPDLNLDHRKIGNGILTANNVIHYHFLQGVPCTKCKECMYAPMLTYLGSQTTGFDMPIVL